jgi:hypothetical protein
MLAVQEDLVRIDHRNVKISRPEKIVAAIRNIFDRLEKRATPGSISGGAAPR